MAVFNLSDQYKYKGKGPFDAKSLVKTFDELLLADSWTVDGTFAAYNGMIVAVWLNKSDTTKNGIYYLFDSTVTNTIGKPNVSNEANWHKLVDISELADFSARLSEIESTLTALESRVTELEEGTDDVITYGYRKDFPSAGELNKLYVAADEGKTYVWFNDSYLSVGGGDYEDPAVVFGGTAD